MGFNKGDKVNNKDGESFSNGQYVATVDFQDGQRVWLKETGTFTSELSIEHFVNKKAEGGSKLDNNKLLKVKQVPIFDKEIIKKGMIITVKHGDCGPINGIISLVTEEKIRYYDRIANDNYVLIHNVVDGTTQIKIAESL